MNTLKFIIVLAFCRCEVRTAPPQSLCEMRNIVEYGVTVDLSGSWWTSDVRTTFDPKTNRLRVGENIILKDGRTVSRLKILYAMVFNGEHLEQYPVGHVKAEGLQPTVYSFTLQHHRRIFNRNWTKEEMEHVSSYSMSFYIEVEHWSKTIQREAFQVVSVGHTMTGYRINRTQLLGAKNLKFSTIGSELKMKSTVVIDPSNSSRNIQEFRIKLEDSIYYFLKLTDEMKPESPGYIKVVAKYGDKDADEAIIGSIVEVYATDTDKADQFVRIAEAPKDVIRKPKYKSKNNEELVGKDTEWIFISIW